MAQSIYGVESIIFDTPVAGAFPAFKTTGEGATGFMLDKIVTDSFTFNDSAPSTNDINIEEINEPYEILNSDNGTKSFTFQIYNMDETMYQKLMGYADADSEGFYAEDPEAEVTKEFAVQVTTKPLNKHKARVIQYARMRVNITRSGNLAKSGLLSFNLECTRLANIAEDGTVKTGKKWKYVE